MICRPSKISQRHLDLALLRGIAALSVTLVSCSDPGAPDQQAPTTGGAAGAATGGEPAGGAPAGGAAGAATGGEAPAGGTASTAGTSSGGMATGGSGGAGGAAATSGQGGAGLGGAPGGAGGGGTGGSGGGQAGAPSGTCSNGAIVCEDFEGYAASSAPAGGWTASVRGNGKIVVDASRAFSGKQSLHVTGKMNADRPNISRPIQTESQSAYVSFRYFVASYPASSGVHTRLMRIGTTQAASGNPDSSYSLASYNGIAIEKVNSIYLRDTGTKLNSPQLLNRWSCLEFAVDRSGGVGKVKVQLWVDGKELSLSKAGSSSHGMTSASWDPIPFELFMLGLDGFQADDQAADFWIDDLSVTPQRVGCAAAAP